MGTAEGSRQKTPPRWLVPLLAAVIGINPLAVDAYLPALTLMATDFGAGLQTVESSISTYLFGYAAGLLLAAPASDRFGRRPIAILGILIFLTGTTAIVFSQTVNQLLLFRLVQALGAGCTLVNVGAIVKDLFDEHQSARTLSLISTIMMAIPLVAPLLGAFMIQFYSWRSIFVVLNGYAVFILVLVILLLPETASRKLVGGGEEGILRQIYGHLGSVLAHRRATAFVITASLGSTCMFLFLTDAAFVYMQYFGVSAQTFPILFAANIVTMALFHQLNIRLLRVHEPRKILPWGVAGLCLCTLAMLIYTIFFDPTLPAVVGFVMITLGSQTLIANNALAAYMSRFRDNAGMANAIAGSLSFAIAGTASLALAVFHDGSVRSLAVAMAASAVLAAASAAIALRE